MEGFPKKDFIVDGFTHGFMIKFEGEEDSFEANNSKAARLNPEAVSDKIRKEVQAGHIAGPFDEPPFENFRCSPLSLREKSTASRYRPLHNLAYPYNERSINHNIPKKYSTVQYSTLQNAIQLIPKHGAGCYMVKSDMKGAFRIVPLHPSQYHLMGFKWENKYYYDKNLAMGLSSFCQIFETISDAVVFILNIKYNVTDVVKILDDFSVCPVV